MSSDVVNSTEYGIADTPTAVILKVASEPSDTLCVDGSMFITISVAEKDDYNMAS